MDSSSKCANGVDNSSLFRAASGALFVTLAGSSESVATMPTTEARAENTSPVLVDCTISGDRGMLVLRAAEPDRAPVSPGEGIRYVTLRLCTIVGVAMLIAAALLWFPAMRQSANLGIQPDKTPTQVANSGEKVKVQPTTVESPLAQDDLSVTIGKSPASVHPPDEAAPTGGTPPPMQVANSGGKVELPPTKAESPGAGNDLAVTIAKPPATAPSFPAPEAAPAGGTPKPMSASVLTPGASSTSESATQLDKNEIAMLVARGKDFLKEGDLASARLLFQRAATAGNAESCFILGTTYDPLFIRRIGVVGMKSDIALAREWYKKAAELGSADATQQLATLQRRHWE